MHANTTSTAFREIHDDPGPGGSSRATGATAGAAFAAVNFAYAIPQLGHCQSGTLASAGLRA